VVFPCIEKTNNNLVSSYTKNRYELNTIKENIPLNSVVSSQNIIENPPNIKEGSTRINPKLKSIQNVTSKYSIFARDNKSLIKFKSKEKSQKPENKETNKKVNNNTVSPNKNLRSDGISEEAKSNKIKRLISDHKIIIEKIKKIYTVNERLFST
jgi:hypothetical protein